MRAILIDPKARAVSEVVADGTLEDIHRLLGCTQIEGVYFDDRHVLYADEEALLADEPGPFFTILGHPQPIAGRGLIFSRRDDGEDGAAIFSVSWFHARVEFPDIEFAGFRDIPEGTTQDIGLGPMPVIGYVAIFRKRGGN